MSASTIGVIGAGIMGGGITQVAACKGLNVVLVDVNDRVVQKAIDGVSERLIRLASKGKITASEKVAALQRAPILCAGVTSYKGIKETEAKPGEWIAISGIGGLGQLAVQYVPR